MHKSRRHAHAARCRWRAAEARAEAEREDGIPDRERYIDPRRSILIDLRSYGGRLIRIEPRIGYVAARAVDDETGEVLYCAALKELLHWIADDLARWASPRGLQ